MSLPNVAQGDPHVAAHNAERGLINDLQDLSDETFVNGLKATYAQFTDTAGEPLTGTRVRIVVDSFGDIDDIISEET